MAKKKVWERKKQEIDHFMKGFHLDKKTIEDICTQKSLRNALDTFKKGPFFFEKVRFYDLSNHDFKTFYSNGCSYSDMYNDIALRIIHVCQYSSYGSSFSALHVIHKKTDGQGIAFRTHTNERVKEGYEWLALPKHLADDNIERAAKYVKDNNLAARRR